MFHQELILTEEGTNLIKANHACTVYSPYLNESLTCWTLLKCYREIKFVNHFKSIPLIAIFFESRNEFKISPALVFLLMVALLKENVNVGINSNRVEMEKVLHYRKCLEMEHIRAVCKSFHLEWGVRMREMGIRHRQFFFISILDIFFDIKC